MIARPRSLAGALYIRIVVAVAMIGIAMAGLSLAIADRAIDRASDAQLITAANVLFALMEDELNEPPSRANSGRPIEIDDDLLSHEDARAFHASADWRMFFVFRDGRPVMRSDTAPPIALIPRDAGFHEFTAANGKWRTYGLRVPRFGLVLVVGERLHARHIVIHEVLARLLLPFLALLPLTAVLLHLSLRSGLASLRRLSGALAERSPQDLSRLDRALWPRDLAVLIAALNRLFERVDAALAREQGFTDDAAHQLRTPLATMRLQAQMAAAALQDRDRALGQDLLASVDRASALVDRMLELARLETMPITNAPFDLRAVATTVIADHALLAVQKGVEFTFCGDDAVPVTGDAAILALALAAVIENAIKHSPSGGQITVEAKTADANDAEIIVTDEGPGIAQSDRERLFDRFVRGLGPNAGTGLGLTIARRAMTMLGGAIEFADPDDRRSGLMVKLTTPA